MNMGNAIPVEARGLTKRYGPLLAVDNVDFAVARGECVGFLGPNGAGKTTTVRMLTCFTPPSGGTARVFGMDVRRHPRRIKARIGICPQEDNLDPDFDVRRNLLVYARYFDIPLAVARKRADELLVLMQLTERAASPIGELSGGMKRRLILARALLNEPDLLVLDEPTTGLDPQARHLIWQRIRQLLAGGTTVVLTTHYMEEASQLCQRVILMNQARILLSGSPAELVAREIGRRVIELWNVTGPVRRFVAASGWPVEEAEGRTYIFERDEGSAWQELERRFPDQERRVRSASLEDVFLRIAGRSLLD